MRNQPLLCLVLLPLGLASARPVAAQAVVTVHNESPGPCRLVAGLPLETKVRVQVFQKGKAGLETIPAREEAAGGWALDRGWSIRIESLPDAGGQHPTLVLGLTPPAAGAGALDRFSLFQWRQQGLPLVVKAGDGSLSWPAGSKAWADRLGSSDGTTFTLSAKAISILPQLEGAPATPERAAPGYEFKTPSPRAAGPAGTPAEHKSGGKPLGAGVPASAFPPQASRRLVFRSPGPELGAGFGAGLPGPAGASPAARGAGAGSLASGAPGSRPAGFHLAAPAPAAAPSRPFGTEAMVITNRSGVSRRVIFPDLAGPLLVHGPTLSNGHCPERTLEPQAQDDPYVDLAKGNAITVFSAAEPGPFELPFRVSCPFLAPGQPGQSFRWQRLAGAAASPRILCGLEGEAPGYDLPDDNNLVLESGWMSQSATEF